MSVTFFPVQGGRFLRFGVFTIIMFFLFGMMGIPDLFGIPVV